MRAELPSLKELDNYIIDLAELEKYENSAEDDLKTVENLEFWKATQYENKYLPSLRLTGLNNQRVNLLNRADLHMHTQWSDGDDLDRVLDTALKLRLDAIAITDHDEIEGAFEARRRVHQRRLKIAIVPGVEVSSKDGHIGALFVMRKIPKGLSAVDTVKLIHEAGGIAVAHHPYAPPIIEKLCGVKLGCGDLIKEIPFNAIECTNAVPGYGKIYNIAAHDSMKKNNIICSITGSSDAHYAGFVGKGITYYPGNEGLDSLYQSLKLGFSSGAESYWKTREKILYYMFLCKAILKAPFRKRNSVS